MTPPSKTVPNSSPAWLRYVSIPQLSEDECRRHVPLVIVGESKFPLRAAVNSATDLCGHLTKMDETYGPLVLLHDYLPYTKAPTLIEAFERRVAVQAAKRHVHRWLLENARGCLVGRVVVKTDFTGSVYVWMAIPLSALDANDQKTLTDAVLAPKGLVQVNGRSACRGVIFNSKGCRKVARLMCDFPDGRINLDERHPDSLAVKNELAEQQLKLEAPEKRVSLSFCPSKKWLQIVKRELAEE